MPELRPVDLLIEGGSVMTMDASRRIIRDGAIAVDGDRIVAVDKRETLRGRYRGKRVVDGSRHVITPGLVNSHIHFYHQMHRGMAPDNFDGNEWSNFVHAKVAPILTVEDEVWASYIVLLELLKTGSTTYLAAGSYNPGPVLEAIPRVGLRGFEGRRTFDHVHLGHQAMAEPTDKCVQENAAVMEKYAAGFANGLVRPCVNIVGLGRCTDTLIVKSKELADKYGAILNMHQCAFPEEVESIKKRTGRTPIKHLEHLGALGPNVVLVHMLHVTDEEIEILARTGTHVIHNPGTALKIVYGLTKAGKFPEMLKAGVNVALGTDAGDCANFMDIVRAIYLAALLFKDIRFDPHADGRRGGAGDGDHPRGPGPRPGEGDRVSGARQEGGCRALRRRRAAVAAALLRALQPRVLGLRRQRRHRDHRRQDRDGASRGEDHRRARGGGADQGARPGRRGPQRRQAAHALAHRVSAAKPITQRHS